MFSVFEAIDKDEELSYGEAGIRGLVSVLICLLKEAPGECPLLAGFLLKLMHRSEAWHPVFFKKKRFCFWRSPALPGAVKFFRAV